MAKDQAKITFTADTRELTKQIKEADSALSALKSSVKLSDAAFKNSGNSVEHLTEKQKILEAELEANRSKQEALSGKVEAAKNIYGENSTQVNDWTKKLTDAQTEEQKLISALTQCEQALERQTAEEQKAKTPLEQLNTKIGEQHRELEKLKTEYKNVALEQGTDSAAAQELKSKIDQLNKELDQEEGKLKEVDKALEETGEGAQNAANGGWTVLKGIITDLASNAIQQGIDKIKEFGRETIQSGIDFTSSMSNVQALSGATDDELSKLEETARELGASTIFSATDVSDAFGYMALAGWDVEEMLGGIEGVLNLAAAGNMDLAEASDIVTDYLTAFGLSAEDAGGFVDQMAYAMANSNTDVTQLGDAYKNVAATASSMGYSVEDTTAVLMTMADAGVKGGEAGTALSAIMTRLATDTKGCASTLEDYGVEIYDSQGNMNDLASILEGCRGVWNDLTQEEQANLAKSIAGTSHYSQFATIMDGLQEGTDGATSSFRKNTDALEEVRLASERGESAAADMADTMQNNLGGDLASLGSSMDEFKLRIYDAIENPLRDVVQTATQVVDFISSHMELIAGVGAVLGTVTAGIVAYNVATAASAAVEAAEVTSLGALIAAKMAAAATTAAMMLPYIAVAAAIAAVIAIIVLCVRHWDEIKNKMSEVANTIKTAVTTAWTNLQASISTTIANIKTTITGAWSAIQSFTTSVWNAIKTAITTPIQTAKSTVTGVFNGIKSTVSGVVNGIKSTVSSAFNAIKSAMTRPIETAKSTISGIMNRIKGMFPLHIGRIFTGLSLPHISVSGGSAPFGIGGKGSLPHFSVSWHAKGVIFDAPTLIPTLDGVHGVGEAGPEAVSPISTLQDYIGVAVQKYMPQPDAIDYKRLASELSNLNTFITLDGRTLGRAVRRMV